MKRHLIIGTRGSAMAFAQTAVVERALLEHYPDLVTTTKVITTKGDQNMAPIPLDTVGKTWFTKEIETALLGGEIDVAIHSLKDLAPEPPEGLLVLPVLPRNDARDVLVPRKPGLQLHELQPGAIIGTDSLRRKANLLRLRPDLVVQSVRGNVQTRLQKRESGAYDALVLAGAGLERVDEVSKISQWFDTAEFVPAFGQGALAAEIRTDDTELSGMLRTLQDEMTVAALAAEQAFSAVIGGGCKVPAGCYVSFHDGVATIHGMLGSDDATKAVVRSVSGPAAEAARLARTVADTLKQVLATV
jgi:hydroxymethylbilane synthase